MIRIATSTVYQSSNQSIMADQAQVMNTTAQLSSGKQINSPADNPVGAAIASSLQSDISQLGQYKSNQSQASSLLNMSSSALTQMLNVLQSIRTTMVQAGNSTNTPAQYTAMAAQVQQNLNELVALGNSGDGQGGYLFGGSVNNTPPFSQSGNAVSYHGDSINQQLQVSVANTVQSKYSGQSVFLNIPTGSGGTQSVFQMVGNAINALQSSNPTSQSGSILTQVDQAITALGTTQASMGAGMQAISAYGNIGASQTLQDQTQSGNIVDTNYAQAASQLSQQQTQFQAALQSYSAISKLSLFNYI